jgi:hypothetical protein
MLNFPLPLIRKKNDKPKSKNPKMEIHSSSMVLLLLSLCSLALPVTFSSRLISSAQVQPPSSIIFYPHGIPDNEYIALEDFYASLDGKYWEWKNYPGNIWNFSSPSANPCSDNWQGLTCSCNFDLSGCSIIEIGLENYNLTGSIPISILNLTNLTVLNLKSNRIVDPLPGSLKDLILLSDLQLASNSLTVMPEVVYQCYSLTGLDLSFNQIVGTLSSEIGNLVSLRLLSVEYNYFYGTVPFSLYQNLIHLRYIYFTNNNFTGTIPYELENLWHLEYYYASNNQFFGTIPEKFKFVVYTLVFDVSSNLLSGSFPASSLIYAQNLGELLLFSNSFTGNWEFLPSLSYLYLYDNFFNGSLNFLHFDLLLYGINLSNNLFSGSVSSTVTICGNFRAINYYEIADNYLTGTFPCTTGAYPLQASQFIVASNYFSGSLSLNLTSFPLSLLVFNISKNLFSGTVPPLKLTSASADTYKCRSSYLEKVDFSYNYFTGNLPNLECSGIFQFLYYLSFSNNQFTGNLPANYSSFKGPTVNTSSELFFNSNLLSGPLSASLSLFTNSSNIAVLELSDNIFTGSIGPPVFFQTNSQHLSFFDVGNNCLTGSVPTEVCELSNIEVLNLDGASSSSFCQILLFPANSLFTSFISEHSLEGSVPSCLFSLSKIQTLHLSGNGLSGSLSNILNISNSLTDLSLSHNLLTGTIPIPLQTKQNWVNLDLSYNKLSGSLSSDFAVGNTFSFLSLQLNRLSGDVPSSLVSASVSSLAVLQGNVFYCSALDKSSALPADDEDYKNYSCSSDTAYLIVVLYSVALGLFVLSSTLLLYKFLEIRKLLTIVDSWRTAFSFTPISPDSSLVEVVSYFASVWKVVLWMCVFFLITILPIWVILKRFYSTYTFQYIWTVGALFISGESAGIVLTVVFCVSSLFLFYLIEWYCCSNLMRAESGTRSEGHIVPSPKGWKMTSLLFSVYFLLFLFDCIIMLSVDAAFVVAVLKVSASQLVLVEVAAALLRVWVNNSLIWNMIPIVSGFVENISFKITKKSLFTNDDATRFAVFTPMKLEDLVDKQHFLGALMIINKILFPILVIMIILPDCFYYAFFQAPTISSSENYETCFQYTRLHCFGESTSSETTTFVPPFTYYYLCSSNLITYYTAVYVWTFFFIGFFTPAAKLFIKYLYDKYEGNGDRKEDRLENRSSSSILTFSFLKDGLKFLVLNRFRSFTPSPQPDVLPLFSVDRFTCQINSYIAFMFCFGLLFPPLGVIAGISILLVITFEYLTLGKMLKETRALGYDWYEKELAKESKGIMQSLRSSVGWMIFISCLLFGLFVFDSIGDEAGWQAALVGMVVIIVFPISAVNIYWIAERRFLHECLDIPNEVSPVGPQSEVELRQTISGVVDVENPINNRN